MAGGSPAVPVAEVNEVDEVAERRQSLLDAAVAVIAQKGLIGTTISSIATEAECSYGVVSFHFNSKEGIILAALDYLREHADCVAINLGTGRGYSVLEMVAAFSRACGRDLPYVIAPRRAGDIAQCWADPAKARQELGWQASRTLDDMTADTWRWQSQNPNGYPDA